MEKIVALNKLAINGGGPTRTYEMPPRIALGPDEEKMIYECIEYYKALRIDPGYQGHFEKKYCKAFEEYMGGRGYADAVSTGSAALFIAIAALQLPKGSHILVSPITDPGTLSAIILNGMIPKLVDSMPNCYNIGHEQVLARIDSKTKAIIVVHSAGQAAPMENIMAVARANGLNVIEDCSQAHGAKWNKTIVGNFGDISAFSTMYRKAHMTGASGGVVYTQNKELFHNALAYADRGKPRWREDFDDKDPSGYLFPALNFHTDEISCAIGLSSLGRLNKTIKSRLSFATKINQAMNDSEVCTSFKISEGDSPFILPIIVDDEKITCSKIDFARAVLAEGISLNVEYKYLVRDWAWVKPYLADNFNTVNARLMIKKTFCLYLNEKYTNKEAVDTFSAIKKVENFYKVSI
jgi:dTDP-4-amino-4,6-dideoxygalactose transaminase